MRVAGSAKAIATHISQRLRRVAKGLRNTGALRLPTKRRRPGQSPCCDRTSRVRAPVVAEVVNRALAAAATRIMVDRIHIPARAADVRAAPRRTAAPAPRALVNQL